MICPRNCKTTWFKRSRKRSTIAAIFCIFVVYVVLEDAPKLYIRYSAKLMLPRRLRFLSQGHIHNSDNLAAGIVRSPTPISYGYRNAEKTLISCWQNKTQRPTKTVSISLKLENDNKTVFFCPIFKVGTTFFKRLFSLNSSNVASNGVDPYSIQYNYKVKLFGGVVSPIDQHKLRVMFARNPYHRLLSGYVDKLLAPNPVYWNIISRNAIRMVRPKANNKSLTCGHDLTFAEYVNYAMKVLEPGSLRTKNRPDGHFQPMVDLCKPCSVQYDFIGKMENFAADSLAVADMLDMPKTKALLQANGSALAADDALLDTCHQPFFFRTQFRQCITMFEALQRAWKKLQIRGIVGDIELPVSEEDAEYITQDEFFKMAREARFASSSHERRLVKESAFKEYFNTISLETLRKIQKNYKDDFRLFNYSDTPKEIFDKFISS